MYISTIIKKLLILKTKNMETQNKTQNNNTLKPGKTTAIPSTKEFDRKLSANIMLALEVKQAFEMYSYRIISPDDFIERITELTEFHTTKNI